MRLGGLRAPRQSTAVAYEYRAPDVAGIRKLIDTLGGRYTAQLDATGATHFVDEYWTAWPAVFHSALTRYERGEARRVWGVSYRAEPTAPLWAGTPRRDILIAMPRTSTEGERWLRELKLWPVVSAGATEHLLLFRLAGDVSGG